MSDQTSQDATTPIPNAQRDSRRRLLQGSVALSAGLLLGGGTVQAKEKKKLKGAKLKGNINHSVVQWCFQDHWNLEQMAKVATSLGITSIELVEPEDWPILKKHGLKCAISGSHGFEKGPNHPENWDFCREILTKRIEQAAEFGCPNVITFTGMAGNMSAEEGADNCVKFFKQIAPVAEKYKINLCLEMLNTRDDSHPMKGHPGYQGDHVDYCIDILKRVGSPRMLLLFDFYHVQIMDGDLIRRVHQCKDYLGHIHTAGNPGRAELDPTQEINYPAVMQALVDVGYKGFVGHEFIPTRDPLAGLHEAVQLCDV